METGGRGGPIGSKITTQTPELEEVLTELQNAHCRENRRIVRGMRRQGPESLRNMMTTSILNYVA